jgi:hypothetical protein
VPARASMDLFGEITDRGWGVRDPGNFIARLRDSITADLASPSPRLEFPAKQLADFDVIVSNRSSVVAHARTLFPRTWRRVAEETCERHAEITY